MRKRSIVYAVAALSVGIPLLLVYWQQLLGVFSFIYDFEDSFKDDIGYIVSVITIGLYVKQRFYDTRVFHKMKAAYGQHKLLISLNLVNEILQFMNPEELIELLDKLRHDGYITIQMRGAVDRISRITRNEDCVIEEPEIELTRKERNILKKKIRELVRIANRRIELHFLESDAREDLEAAFRKFTTNKHKYAAYEQHQHESGRRKLTKKFNTDSDT
jgi:hypothetical protein